MDIVTDICDFLRLSYRDGECICKFCLTNDTALLIDIGTSSNIMCLKILLLFVTECQNTATAMTMVALMARQQSDPESNELLQHCLKNRTAFTNTRLKTLVPRKYRKGNKTNVLTVRTISKTNAEYKCWIQFTVHFYQYWICLNNECFGTWFLAEKITQTINQIQNTSNLLHSILDLNIFQEINNNPKFIHTF